MKRILKELSDDLREKIKNCRSGDEVVQMLKDNGVSLTEEQIAAVSGGWDNIHGNGHEGCLHPYWGYENCVYCPACYNECPVGGDSRDDVKPENVSRAFSEGRISGADFFA